MIAATNRDLKAAIAAGTFRSDLFYRLDVFPIEMPSLRERQEDIPLLVEYFIDRFARQAGKRFQAVNKKSLDLLQSYSWPGNIRELQNVIERSVIVCETETFTVDESWLSRQPSVPVPASGFEPLRRLPSQEKEIIEAVLRESCGRVYGPAGAAAKLGIPRSTLEHKIRSLRSTRIVSRAAILPTIVRHFALKFSIASQIVQIWSIGQTRPIAMSTNRPHINKLRLALALHSNRQGSRGRN